MKRRDFLYGSAALAALTAATPSIAQEVAAAGPIAAPDPALAGLPAELQRRPLPASPGGPLDPVLVQIPEGFRPGDLHVDPNIFRLFFILPDNQAIRYAVGVGRGNLYHAGVFRIGAKQEWPTWTPTPEMIARDPEHYEQYADGMEGGVDNPLGARALYLYEGNRDSYLRIHGTNAPRTIGTAVSNGCARLTNEYITDLYPRVNLNATAYLYNKIA